MPSSHDSPNPSQEALQHQQLSEVPVNGAMTKESSRTTSQSTTGKTVGENTSPRVHDSSSATASNAGELANEGMPSFDELTAELEAELQAELEAELGAELEAELAEPAIEEQPSTCPCEGLLEPVQPVVYSFGYDSDEAPASRVAVATSAAQQDHPQGPMMKRLAIMPPLYHHEDPINFYSLAHHVVLDASPDWKTLYLNLGLYGTIGKSLAARVRRFLQTPGNALKLNEDDMDECKMKIVRVAHTLLYHQDLGREFLDRPALGLKDCKRVRWSRDSTEVLLEFSSLLYKIALKEQERREYKDKPQAAVTAPTDAVGDPAASTAEHYASPSYVLSNDAQAAQTARQGRNDKRKHDAQQDVEQPRQEATQTASAKRVKTRQPRGRPVAPAQRIQQSSAMTANAIPRTMPTQLYNQQSRAMAANATPRTMPTQLHNQLSQPGYHSSVPANVAAAGVPQQNLYSAPQTPMHIGHRNPLVPVSPALPQPGYFPDLLASPALSQPGYFPDLSASPALSQPGYFPDLSASPALSQPGHFPDLSASPALSQPGHFPDLSASPALSQPGYFPDVPANVTGVGVPQQNLYSAPQTPMHIGHRNPLVPVSPATAAAQREAILRQLQQRNTMSFPSVPTVPPQPYQGYTEGFQDFGDLWTGLEGAGAFSPSVQMQPTPRAQQFQTRLPDQLPMGQLPTYQSRMDAPHQLSPEQWHQLMCQRSLAAQARPRRPH